MSNRDLANHIGYNSISSTLHRQWIQFQGINYSDLSSLKSGKLSGVYYQQLVDIIEKDCKYQSN
jgi:hypothetical protein